VVARVLACTQTEVTHRQYWRPISASCSPLCHRTSVDMPHSMPRPALINHGAADGHRSSRWILHRDLLPLQ